MVLADEEPLGLGGGGPTADSDEDVGSGGGSKAGSEGAAAPRPPLLARPMGYSLLWVDEQRMRAGDTDFLSLWRPVPPAGYVALGHMAGTGAMPPPTAIMR